MARQSQNFAFPRFRMEEKFRRITAALLVAFSVITTLAGLITIVAFDNAPGAPSSPLAAWPPTTHLKREARRPELLVFAHPYCVCTAATIAELAKLLASQPAGAAPGITFVVYRPGRSAGWSWKSLKNSASALPNNEFLWDDAGREARRFGATTSGMVLLYNVRGNLQFAGGITGSRGHEGDNYGLDALRAALTTTGGNGSSQPAGIARSRVFGCALGSEDSDPSLPGGFTDWFTTLGQDLFTILHRNAQETRL